MDHTRPVIKGRGTTCTPTPRFAQTNTERDPGPLEAPATIVRQDPARSIITRNRSPDVPFEQSINPYRGCEHGCIYCFARPSHSYLDLSPGLEFETRLFYKSDAARLLERELARPGYQCRPIVIGTNTDAYQPIERQHRITRQLLEVLLKVRHPVGLITKSSLIKRDLDLLEEMAALNLVSVSVSITSLDPALKRTLEPRAASPAARLETIAALTKVGVPVSVLVAPVIPALTDHELEKILAASAEAGAGWAGYILLRLPHEVGPLFAQWLQTHHPLRAEHVMSLLRQMRGGRDNDSRFGRRMRGQGEYARLLAARFYVACRRHGINSSQRPVLSTENFRKPGGNANQLSLFD